MMVHDVWVEVDTSALKHNFRQVRSHVGSKVKIMAVVKGNGFGHGYIETSRAFVEAGADALAVTRIEEALPIREAGIDAPILLFAPIQPENAEDAITADLDMTTADPSLVKAISAAASKLGKIARIHIKIDTGMGRLGMSPSEVSSFFSAISESTNVKVAGVYTHFATAADRDLKPTLEQNRRFKEVLQLLNQSNVDYGLAHAANSAAILRMADARYDMVRPGTILYGQYPSQHAPHSLDLKPTWKLKARICEIKDLSSGASVSYGAEYTTKRPTRAAVIPIGYADGFTLVPEGPAYRQSILKFAIRKSRRALSVTIKDQKAPVIGRVAMQMAVVDVSHIPGVQVGDEVVVPAMRIPTSPLIPRIYL